MQPEKLTQKSQEALQEAQRLAREHSHQKIGGEQLPAIASMTSKAFISACIACCLIFLTGCATVGKPPQSELQAVEAGHKCIVLFRVTITTDKHGQLKRSGVPFVVYLRALDRELPVQMLYSDADFSKWIAPSKTTAKDGWRYLVLEPGDYYVSLWPRGRAVKQGTNTSCFLSVPPNKPVIYAGSFCFSKQVIPRSFFGKLEDMGFTFYQIKASGIQDESEEASRIVGATLAEFGTVTPSLGVPFDNLSATVLGITNGQIVIAGADTNGSLGIDDVGADRTLLVAYPVLAPGMLMLKGSQRSALNSNGESNDPAGEAVGIGLLLAAAPFAIVADKIVGEPARKRWEPYASKLKQEFAAFKFEEQLTNAIRDRLSAIHPTTNGMTAMENSPKVLLQIEPSRVLLTETRFGKYSLEIGVRVRLVDTATKKHLWGCNYVYTDVESVHSAKAAALANDDDLWLFRLSSEVLIPVSSTPHKLNEFKGDAGVALLHNELAKAVTAIGDEIAERILKSGFN